MQPYNRNDFIAHLNQAESLNDPRLSVDTYDDTTCYYTMQCRAEILRIILDGMPINHPNYPNYVDELDTLNHHIINWNI